MQIPFKDREIGEAGKSQASEEQVQANSDDFNLGIGLGRNTSILIPCLLKQAHSCPHLSHMKGTTGCISLGGFHEDRVGNQLLESV